MPALKAIVETTEYRLVLVLPETRKILAVDDIDGYHLPSISIPLWTRPTEQLHKAVRTVWKSHILILEFFYDSPLCALAEVIVLRQPTDLKAVSLERLHPAELSEQQRARIAVMLAGDTQTRSPFSRVGWIDEGIAWLESETASKLTSKSDIVQLNAGGSFALIRFRMKDGRVYWLKATGKPNAHELSITMLLSKLCGGYLPEIISAKSEWNAWLMSGDGRGVKKMPTSPLPILSLLEDAVESMAKLQIQTQGYDRVLLDAGAFNQDLEVFENQAAELFDYVEEAMSLQTSAKVPRLEKRSIQRLRDVFREVCDRVKLLKICRTIVHGDMNHGNILVAARHCQFIDWSEAYVGNPLITLQHLLLLNRLEDHDRRASVNSLLKQKYLDAWVSRCNPDALRKGFIYMPILALISTLYGRGDWLNSPRRNDPHRLSYTRSLARHMDRATYEPSLLEVLCP
jgi:hypothetical protein